MSLHRLILAASLLFGFVCASNAAEPGYPFNQYKKYRYEEGICGGYTFNMFDKGPWKASCRVTELVHLINMGDKTIRRFESLACARGETENEAKFNARAHGSQIITALRSDDLRARGAKPETDQTYVNDGATDSCVITGSPASPDVADRRQSTVPPEHTEEEDDQPSPVNSPNQRANPQQNSNQVTFIIHNQDRYKLGLEFYSQTRNAAWPGGDKQYGLLREGTYTLNCVGGEKICFGAWRDHQTKYWGVGKNDKNGCASCCVVCGKSMETTLTDGGADSYPSTASGSSGSSNDAAEIIGGLAGIVNGLSGLRGSSGGSGQTYSVPSAPARRTYNSGISGVPGR